MNFNKENGRESSPPEVKCLADIEERCWKFGAPFFATARCDDALSSRPLQSWHPFSSKAISAFLLVPLSSTEREKMTQPVSFADENLFSAAVLTIYLFSALNVVSLLFITAPYGKHSRSGWGPSISPPIAWFLMESPMLWLSLLFLPIVRHRSNPIALFILSLFLVHYINRTIIYPLHLRRFRNSGSGGGGFPISIVAMALVFNFFNAYVQIRSVTHYADYGRRSWTGGIWMVVRVVIGLGIFLWGMAVNVRSDLTLVRLKAEGRCGYKIPTGRWFELVSCPNYMGEVAEWLGWAMIAWSPAAFGFMLFTAANLVFRARSHHKWYLEKFGDDYPRSRKAVVPYIL